MASSNTDSPGTIYRWIERKPLTEAVTWTSREKFWLITAACHYGTHDWKSVAQVVRNAGEPYRPREWYTPKSCERQFKILVSNLSKEVKSLPLIDMLQHIAEGLKNDYIRDANKSKDTLKSKYCNLFSVLNRVKQGNLSRNEVVSLYSQARRNEIEGKQYMDQLMTRQNASLASENSSSGLIEEQPIKWNTPSAPLLTSLLRSRNTIPANRTATTIASLLQSPGGTSRTRSGKLLPSTPIIRTTQGTPTLSKLLEAPANPYISSPPQSTQKNKLSEVGTEKLVNTSRKENSQSTSLNKVRVDNITTLGSLNQINKSDLSASKKQISKTPVSAVKNGSKANSSVVNLLSDSETDEDTKNTTLKSSFGDKKDTSSRIEPRATRSQTRAEGGVKQLNDTKLSDGKKERETLRQQSGESQINETHLIDDDLLDIDQIEVEPLSSVQDEIQTQTPSKMTRSSLQRLRLSNPGDNVLTNNKVNSKGTSNKMLEKISVHPDFKCLLGNVVDDLSFDVHACKDAITLRKDSRPLQNTLTTYDGKLLKQKGVIEIKASSIRCIDSRNDSKLVSFTNHPMVVVNKIKKPLNMKFASEQINKTNDIQVSNTDVNKPIRLNNSSLNVVKLIDSSCSLPADEVIIIDDDININEDNRTTMKAKELLSKVESKTFPSTVSSNSKSTTLQLDEKINKNDKTPWNMFGKAQNILDATKKQSLQDSVTKSRTNSNINESNQFIKELDFDFDQSISQTSLSELYNGVEEIVEMHSFDNEELNSLIECGSLDSNETEERIDTVSVDQGDSSVSESDSTIGAFDTFAQITRVRQKSFTSKDIKDTKESKTTNQGVNHLKESFCPSEEIYDDQSSTVSVTGIPVLQGVISDVMSQIDLDCVASNKTITPHKVPITDVVEISSDEEVTVDVPKSHPLSVKQIQTQEKEVKSYKLKEDELIQIHEIEAKMYNRVTIKRGTSTSKPINIEMPPCVIVRNITSDADRVACNKILEIKKDTGQKHQDIEMMTLVSNAGSKRDENELNVIQTQKITVKSANEKLLKETERMKKEAKESEERKKKEAERKNKENERMKQEDKERKTKEDDERKKKVEDERKKIELDRKKKELEKKLLNDLYERKKKEEEERKHRENNERKKKEENERKIKELQEKMKIEEERKRLEKIEEEGKNKIAMDKRLKIFYDRLKKDLVTDENKQLASRVVVKEEIVDECVDEILEDIIDEDICIKNEYSGCIEFNEYNPYNQYNQYNEYNEQNECNENNKNHEYLENNKNKYDNECNNEYNEYNDYHNEYDGYNDEIVERIRMPNVISEEISKKYILNISSEELTQIRDYELQSIEESIKKRIKSKTFKRNEDLRSNKELRVILPRDVQEAEKPRAVEVEIQRSKIAERQRADEMASRKVKEAEMKRVKDFELERFKNDRIKIVKEVETKKHKEAELRKNIAVEETEIKGLDKRSTLKKLKEPGSNRSFGHPEVNLVKNYGVVPPVHFKKNNEHLENDTNIEQELIESRKAPINDDFETFDLRERGIEKCMGSEGKPSKEVETNSTEVKIINRTRGLKVEEKLKESYVSKNMSTKLRPQIKSSGSSSSSASPTSLENPSIPSYEYKKQTRNTDDNSKRNITSNTLYDNKNNTDINIDPSVIVRKENLNREVIGIPRTRTRPSSFKQKIISETTSSKQDQDNGAAIIPKETVGTTTIVSTSTHPDYQTTSSKTTPKTISNKNMINDINFDKILVIPVVMLSTSQIKLHKVYHRSVNNFIKQKDIKPTHDQIQKQIVTTTQLDKQPPKKRGRKRRIDIQNEKQESYSRNKTSQNVAINNTSIKEAEHPAKRPRMSLKLCNCENDSVNKTLHQSQKQIVTTTQLDKQPSKKQGRKSKIVIENETKRQKQGPRTLDQIQKQIVTTTQLNKQPPKKRGRKRKIVNENEKQEPRFINLNKRPKRFIDLSSDTETDEDTKNTTLESLFGDINDTSTLLKDVYK
eukprot:XP_016658045.1 PREDICTED: protein PF14_0175 [Acyrthosiphon pisum]